jgi:hypothetical protein
MKFEVGQKVRIIHDDYADELNPSWIGMEGVIVDLYAGQANCVLVAFPDFEDGLAIGEDELEVLI